MSEPITSSIAANAITAIAGSAGVVIAGVNLGVGIGPIVMACVGASFAMSYETEGNLFKKAAKLILTAGAGAGLSIFCADLILWALGSLNFAPDRNGVQMLASLFLSYQMHRTILPSSDKISSSFLDRLLKWGKEK